MSEGSSSPLSLSADQLLALNDEMVALARAGVPLEKGMEYLGTDLPGKLGEVVKRISQNLERGKPLAKALEQEGLPRAYCAVAAAGARTGRLAIALENMSPLIRWAADTNRLVRISLIYPAFLCALACVLFVFTATKTLPVIQGTLSEILAKDGNAAFLQRLHLNFFWWAPAIPAAAIGVMTVIWIRTLRPWRLASERRPVWRTDRWPTVAGVLRAGRLATFADMLALMLEQDVPLAEALVLSGDACGDRRLADECREMAACIERGEPFATDRQGSAFPSILAWLLTGAGSHAGLAESLRRAAENYRTQAKFTSRRLAVHLPIWLTIFVGGSVTVLYALTVFFPWSQILMELSRSR